MKPYTCEVGKPDITPTANDKVGTLLDAYIGTMTTKDKNGKTKTRKADVTRINRDELDEEYKSLAPQALEAKMDDLIDQIKGFVDEFVGTNVMAIAERHCLRGPDNGPILNAFEAKRVIYSNSMECVDESRDVLDHYTFCVDEESTLPRMVGYVAQKLSVEHSKGLNAFVKKFSYLPLKEDVRKE